MRSDWSRPRRAVFEDALAGVEAGRAGNFGYVIGVDRVGQADALRQHGADVVVRDLSELLGPVMIKQPEFTEEPWSLRETGLDLDRLAQTESLFALSNGHLGWRGNLDEGEPQGLPGTYLNGVYEIRPLPGSEVAYGRPEAGQTIINVTNGKLIRLFVDDEPFDVRYGKLLSHERLLDFRAGTLTRHADWVSPAGGAVRISSTRLVSFSHRAIAAVCYEVEPLEGQLQITVQSELLANEQLPSDAGDPRAGFTPDHPLIGEYDNARENAVLLVHKTKLSGLRVAAAMDHLIDAPAEMRTESQVFEDGGHVTTSVPLEPGERLRLIKFVAYDRTPPCMISNVI